ncbi:MAG: formyltetrahydrofolate deformylase [Polyangiaceae bacterium]
MSHPAHARTATLLVSCPDRRGIVAALAQTLYGHGAGIVEADQHTDTATAQFFQRIVIDFSEMHTDRVAIERAIAEVATRFTMSYRLQYAEPHKRVAIFVSRFGHCLHDLLWRHRVGELPCAVHLVVSNHGDLAGVADHYGVPFHHIPVERSAKDEAEARALGLLEEHAVDLVVLARYMQIVSPQFVERYQSRIINIHHSFLPAFVGSRPYDQAQERGVKLIGATAHYVTRDLDEGPIIEQDVTRISHRDAVDDLVRKGRDLERVVLARAVRLHLEDRVLVFGNKTVVFD